MPGSEAKWSKDSISRRANAHLAVDGAALLDAVDDARGEGEAQALALWVWVWVRERPGGEVWVRKRPRGEVWVRERPRGRGVVV